MASKGGGGGDTSSITGFKYSMAIHMGICRGTINELVEIRIGDVSAWTGSVSDNTEFPIDAPNLFGGDDKEGGVSGTLAPLLGDAAQTVQTWIKDILGGLVPDFRGVTTLFFDGLICSNNPYPKAWKMRVRRTTAGWDIPWHLDLAEILIGEIHAMNPAHILYECATNRLWGRGLAPSMIDDDSFLAAAQTLIDEGFGICIRWARDDDIDKFVQTIINHIGAVIYVDRTTGLLTLDLIRNDYTVAALPIFSFTSGLLDITEDQVSSTDTTYNEVIVKWHDPILDKDGQVRVQNLGAIQSIGSIISTSVDYLGLPTAALALRVAQRDVVMQSGQLRRMTLKLDRAGWQIPPGGVFVIQAPSRGIESLVMRAGEITDSPLIDGTITIKAVQDQFGLPFTSYITPSPVIWEPPDRTAHVIDVRRIEELTYYDLAGNLTAADLATVEPDSAAIKTLAKRPTSASIDYMIATATGAEAFVERGRNSWEPTGLLSAGIGAYDTAITFNAVSDPMTVGTVALIDNEYVRVDAGDMNAGTATISRGIIDTLPAAHSSGARIWFEVARPTGDGREYATGETVHVKLLTRTSSAKLALIDAPTDDLLTGARQGRPYPPANFRIDGTRWADVGSVPEGDIVFTWAHRDRIIQGNFLLGHFDGSTGPETDVTYTFRVYNGVTLLRTVTGITAATWTYTAAMWATDGSISPLTFELESYRDGFVSWQKYHFTIIIAEVLIYPGLLTDPDTFYPPTVTTHAHILPGLLTDPDIFYSPTVVPGAKTLLPGLFTDADTFYTPAVTSTAHLLPGLFTDADTFYTPTVSNNARLAPWIRFFPPNRKPLAGSRVVRGNIRGGLWLFNDGPGARSFRDAAGMNPPAFAGQAQFNWRPAGGPFGDSAIDGKLVTGSTTHLNAGTGGNVTDLCLAAPGMTIWAWIFYLGGGNIAYKGDGNSTAGWWFSTTSLGAIDFSVVGSTNNNSTTANGTVTAAAGWTFIAATFNPSAPTNTGVTFYKNGISVARTAQGTRAGSTSDVTRPLCLLGQQISGGGNTFCLDRVDHIGIDRRVYGPNEILDLYKNPFRMFGKGPRL